jgi:hypothetical protein
MFRCDARNDFVSQVILHYSAALSAGECAFVMAVAAPKTVLGQY